MPGGPHKNTGRLVSKQRCILVRASLPVIVLVSDIMFPYKNLCLLYIMLMTYFIINVKKYYSTLTAGLTNVSTSFELSSTMASKSSLGILYISHIFSNTASMSVLMVFLIVSLLTLILNELVLTIRVLSESIGSNSLRTLSRNNSSASLLDSFKFFSLEFKSRYLFANRVNEPSLELMITFLVFLYVHYFAPVNL